MTLVRISQERRDQLIASSCMALRAGVSQRPKETAQTSAQERREARGRGATCCSRGERQRDRAPLAPHERTVCFAPAGGVTRFTQSAEAILPIEDLTWSL